MGSYGSAARLLKLRTLLDTPVGLTIEAITERLPCSERTAYRLLIAIRKGGDIILEEPFGKSKRYRLQPAPRRTALRLSAEQMVALLLSRVSVDYLAGTGIAEILEEVFGSLDSLLMQKDATMARDLRRKLVSVNEHPYRYAGRSFDVNLLITALLKNERLDVAYRASSDPTRATKKFTLRPYSIVVYKRGLYVAGLREGDKAPRLFAVHGMRILKHRRGDRFDYPARFHPKQLYKGAFGIFRGPRTEVRLRFDAKVAPYVVRRKWHATQRLVVNADGSVDMTMVLYGTTELVSWILSYGATAEVISPPALRAEIQSELRVALARYERAPIERLPAANDGKKRSGTAKAVG